MNIYDQAISWLDTFQFHGFRLGLERMEAILDALGNPERFYPSIHVAGTNGKGSVCATCEAFAIESGMKCGFYSSPHLHALNERFRINGRCIGDRRLAEIIFQVKELVTAGFELSYFEYTTVVAMLWFRENRVDLAIFETGLGGRLDATNVIMPQCSVITNVSLEHQTWLGHTLEEIAFEKAGIIKEGVPAVSGVLNRPAMEVVSGQAEAKGSELFEIKRDFHISDSATGIFNYSGVNHRIDGIKPVLRGRHQADNLALAICAWEIFCRSTCRSLEISFENSVRKGAKRVNWPGRGEILQDEPLILLDGAHNPDGISALNEILDGLLQGKKATEETVLLWACSDEGGNKDFMAMLHELRHLFETVIITEPPGPRKPVTVTMWEERLNGKEGMTLEVDWEKAFKMALSKAGSHGVVCVAGSLYLVGAVRNAWMNDPERPL